MKAAVWRFGTRTEGKKANKGWEKSKGKRKEMWEIEKWVKACKRNWGRKLRGGIHKKSSGGSSTEPSASGWYSPESCCGFNLFRTFNILTSSSSECSLGSDTLHLILCFSLRSAPPEFHEAAANHSWVLNYFSISTLIFRVRAALNCEYIFF